MICLFVLIGSTFIDTVTYPWVWLKIVCGTFTYQTYKFLPLHDWERCWRDYWLGVAACWIQFILLSDLKYPSSKSHKAYFVDFWPLYFAFNESSIIDPDPYPWVWLRFVCGLSIDMIYGFDSTECSGEGDSFVIAIAIINWLSGWKAII